MFNIRRFDDVCWPKQSWTFDYILLPEKKLYKNMSLIRCAARANLFKTWILTIFAAPSKLSQI